MGTALAVYEKVDNPVTFASEMAETTAALVGCSLSQGKAVALTCLVEGITPLEFKRTYHLIQGSPTMRADAMLAKFRKAGGKFTIVERSKDKAAIELTSAEGDSYKNEFTREEALASRWPWKDWKAPDRQLKDNWATDTDFKAMLWARLVSDSIRAFAPEIVAGIYTPEEMQDADVIASSVQSNEPKRPTAAEAMAMAAGASGEDPPANGEQVVDAEFEAVDSGGQQQPQQPASLGNGHGTVVDMRTFM